MLLAWLVVNLAPIAAFVVCAGAASLSFWLYRDSRLRYKGEPWCVGCLYPCHGLPQPRCPECGRPLARRPGFTAICRKRPLLLLAALLALGAGAIAAWNPTTSRLYPILPDGALIESQLRGGALAPELLPEFNRRLAGPRRDDFAAQVVVRWLRRSHAHSPLGRAQLLSSEAVVRVGLRRLESAPAAVERASAVAPVWVQIQGDDNSMPWVRSDFRSLLHEGIALHSMACDLPPGAAADDLRIVARPILPKATPFVKVIGALETLPATEPASAAAAEGEEIAVHLDIATSGTTAGGYAAFVFGAPGGAARSEAFDLSSPGSEALQFLGWDWLASPGIVTFVSDRESAASIRVDIRR